MYILESTFDCDVLQVMSEVVKISEGPRESTHTLKWICYSLIVNRQPVC